MACACSGSPQITYHLGSSPAPCRLLKHLRYSIHYHRQCPRHCWYRSPPFLPLGDNHYGVALHHQCRMHYEGYQLQNINKAQSQISIENLQNLLVNLLWQLTEAIPNDKHEYSSSKFSIQFVMLDSSPEHWSSAVTKRWFEDGYMFSRATAPLKGYTR